MTNSTIGESYLSLYDNFRKEIDSYMAQYHINYTKDSSYCEKYCNLNPDELKNMKKSECLDASYHILQAASLLQDELNKNMAVNQWLDEITMDICTEVLNMGIVSKDSDEYKYAKADNKKNMLLNTVTIGKDIKKLSSHINSKIALLNGKIENLKSMSNILFNKGRLYE